MRAKAKQVIVRVLNPTDLLRKSPPLAGEARCRECRLFRGRPCKSSPLVGVARCRECRLFCGRPCKSPPLVEEVRLNRWFRFWELPLIRFLLVLFHHTIMLVVIVA